MIPCLSESLIVQLESASSTNDTVFRMLLDHDTCLVWTTNQTDGRGSRGRNWLSPKGVGLALSVGLRCELSLHPNSFCFPVFAAVWLHQALSDLYPHVAFCLKWPNDLLYDDRKLAGILCESRLVGPRAQVVIGIGINLAEHASFDLLNKPYTTLAQLGRQPDPIQIVEALVASFEPLMSLSPDRIQEAWLARCGISLGEDLSLTLDGDLIRGLFLGLSPDGGLKIEQLGGSVIVISQSVENFQINRTPIL